jgi:hypothetical protein
MGPVYYKINNILRGGTKMSLIKGIGKGMLIILLAVFTFACSTSKSITKQDVEGLKQDSSFKIALWTDRKDKTYEMGEDIYLFFAANKNCHVKLIHISSDGEETVLLPNKYQKDNMAQGGYVYQIPSKSANYTFKAIEPLGEGIIKAVATSEDNSFDLDSKNPAEHMITIKTVKNRP